MVALPEINADKFRADAERAMAIPLGFASPLWFAYAGMASAGVAFWWMSQLARPENLEALHGSANKYALVPVPETPVVEAPALAAEPPPAPLPVVPEVVIPEPALEAATAVVEPAVEQAADDLTRLIGIGPTLALKLADLGVKTYNDIASWTIDDVERYDRTLNLMGRVKREDWVGQARQFAEQGAAY